MNTGRRAALALLFALRAAAVHPQAAASAPAASVSFDTTGFPLWARDLRRAEIVAFGTLPFSIFFTTLGMDLYRSAGHGWDSRYAPWPFKAAGAVDMTRGEHLIVLSVSAALSVLLALTDYLVVRYRRNRAAREAAALGPGTPIIIRRPLSGADGEEPPPGPENPEKPGSP